MTKTDYTAKRTVGEFVQRAGKTFLVLRCGDVFDDERTIRVTPDDVAEFLATLTGSKLTDAGLRELRAALPDCTVTTK